MLPYMLNLRPCNVTELLQEWLVESGNIRQILDIVRLRQSSVVGNEEGDRPIESNDGAGEVRLANPPSPISAHKWGKGEGK